MFTPQELAEMAAADAEIEAEDFVLTPEELALSRQMDRQARRESGPSTRAEKPEKKPQKSRPAARAEKPKKKPRKSGPSAPSDRPAEKTERTPQKSSAQRKQEQAERS